MTFAELTGYDNKRLEPFMKGHPAPAIADVLGFDFRGWNIAAATDVTGTRKFFKGFFGAVGKPQAWGYNMPAVQDGKDKPWRVKTKQGQPVRYFFYGVLPGSALKDAVYPATLVVDYRKWPDYFVLNPAGYVVDYLVYPDPANRDVIVGKSYAQMLGLRIFLGFFILERFGPSGYAGPAGFAP
jgi:hypothetical protein